jgi:hypothetical protein
LLLTHGVFACYHHLHPLRKRTCFIPIKHALLQQHLMSHVHRQTTSHLPSLTFQCLSLKPAVQSVYALQAVPARSRNSSAAAEAISANRRCSTSGCLHSHHTIPDGAAPPAPGGVLAVKPYKPRRMHSAAGVCCNTRQSGVCQWQSEPTSGAARREAGGCSDQIQCTLACGCSM